MTALMTGSALLTAQVPAVDVTIGVGDDGDTRGVVGVVCGVVAITTGVLPVTTGAGPLPVAVGCAEGPAFADGALARGAAVTLAAALAVAPVPVIVMPAAGWAAPALPAW
jgi:hypothetical protein